MFHHKDDAAKHGIGAYTLNQYRQPYPYLKFEASCNLYEKDLRLNLSTVSFS